MDGFTEVLSPVGYDQDKKSDWACSVPNKWHISNMKRKI